MAGEATQTAPAAVTAPAQAAADDAGDIIGDILKTEPGTRDESADEGDAAEEPEAPEAAEAADSDDEDDSAPAEAEDDDAAPAPATGAKSAARKALDDGDIDKAFELAFGKKPEEVMPDAKVWTKWRIANDQAAKAQREREAAIVRTEQESIAKVQAQRSEVHQLIERYKPVEGLYHAIQQIHQNRDPSGIKAWVERATNMQWDEVQKLVLTGQKVSPSELAMRRELQQLKEALEAEKKTKAEQEQKQTAEQAYANDLTIIKGQLKGEVTKVPRFAERVYGVLAKTKGPLGLTITVEEAGRRVLANERRKLSKHPLLPKAPTTVSAAASTLAKAKKAKTDAPPLRRDSRGNGAADDKNESTDDILHDILKSKRRAG